MQYRPAACRTTLASAMPDAELSMTVFGAVDPLISAKASTGETPGAPGAPGSPGAPSAPGGPAGPGGPGGPGGPRLTFFFFATLADGPLEASPDPAIAVDTRAIAASSPRPISTYLRFMALLLLRDRCPSEARNQRSSSAHRPGRRVD